jgi:hypothetical protein
MSTLSNSVAPTLPQRVARTIATEGPAGLLIGDGSAVDAFEAPADGHRQGTRRYHLAFGRSLDLEAYAVDAQRGLRPGHVMRDLRLEIVATTYGPSADRILPIDRARATLICTPAQWALARQLAERLGPDDVVYCNGEDIGIPLAALCKGRADRPRMAIFFHSANRPRVRAMLRLFGLRKAIDVFVSNTTPQFEQLRQSVGNLPQQRWCYLPEQTDTDFFSPGPPTPGKRRPMIASVGLEKRDYRILAQVTADRHLDVRISGFSSDVRPLRKSFPDVMPTNMKRGFYEWPDLVQLYRDADIVVISLFESLDSAGITTLMEAMACGRPIICTRTQGLADYLGDNDVVATVEPGDVVGLDAAIGRLLADPQAALQMGERARARAVRGHSSRPYVEALAGLLRSMP